MRRTVMFFAMIVLPILGYGNQDLVDSLNQELQKAKGSLERGWVYLKLSEAHATKHPDSVIYYSMLAEKEVSKTQVFK